MSSKEPPKIQQQHGFEDEPDEFVTPGKTTTASSNHSNGRGHSNQSNGTNYINTNIGSSSENDLTLDDEKEIAGYSEEIPSLLSEEYRIQQDDEQAETRPVSEKPSVRLFTVLAITGTVIGGIGFIWFAFLAPKPVRQANNTNATPSPTTSPINESADLKSRLAFQEQQRQLNQDQPLDKKPKTPTPSPSPTTKVTPKANTPAPPPDTITRTIVKQAPPPPPRTIYASPPPPQPTPSREAPKTIVPAVPPQPQPKPSVTPTPPVDPNERWLALASLGQVRGASPADAATKEATQPFTSSNQQRSPATTPPSLTPTTTTENNQTIPQTPTPATIVEQANKAIPTVQIGAQNGYSSVSYAASDKSNGMTDGEIGILNQRPIERRQEESYSDNSSIKEVAIGTSTPAKVTVPMVWDGSGQSPTDGRFAVTLTEDMLASDGTVALPSGTVLITQVQSVNQANRLVTMSCVALVYQDSTGSIRQEQVPAGNLLIRGAGNQPLIARGLFDNGGDIARQDLLVGLVSSLARVGEIINQPKQETIIQHNGTFSSISSSEVSPNKSVYAAALEGFFKPLGQRLWEREERALLELEKRPNVAIVAEGTEVSVFVNSFLKVRR